MANIKITPDAQLATPDAIRIRVGQLEKELQTADREADRTVLQRRIKTLQERLARGGVDRSAVNPNLLKSKNDLR